MAQHITIPKSEFEQLTSRVKWLETRVKALLKHEQKEEQLSDWAIRELKESEEDVKAGRVSPSFDNTHDAIAWLDDPNARYKNGDRV